MTVDGSSVDNTEVADDGKCTNKQVENDVRVFVVFMCPHSYLSDFPDENN